MNGEINWSQPIEAVHEDGRLNRALHAYRRCDGRHQVDWYWDERRHTGAFEADGTSLFFDGWRIRNVATPPADACTAPNGGEVGPEVVEVTRITQEEAEARGELCGYGSFGRQGYVQCLRDLGLILPEPVDAIEAIARRLIDQHDEPWPAGTESDRLHYWRDKAITAAKALRALEKEAGR